MKLKKIFIKTVAVILVTTNIAFAQSLSGLKVILDSGHGGSDPGAKAKLNNIDYTEKELNNLITQKLATILYDYGAEVIFTRNPYEDNALDLYKRPEIANSSGAQLFISIHHNSAGSKDANGTEVFYSSNRPNIKTTKYVEFNGARYEYIKESTENGISYVYLLVEGREMKIEKSKVKIIDPSSSTKVWQVLESQKLAQMVVSNLASLGLRNRGAKDSSLVVTKYTTMPSILVEVGFMSNPTELSKIVDEKFQLGVAQKIADAVKQYYSVYQDNKAFFINPNIDIAKRLAGEDRYKTNLAIIDDGWDSSDSVILAYGENYADALTSAALSKKLNAPILLTKGKVLEEDVKSKISSLNAKKVYIIGGQAVISQEIEDSLKAQNVEVIRIKGEDRYKTSIEIATYFDNPKEAFLVTGKGFSDALSVSTVASIKEIPIIYVDNNRYEDALKYVQSAGIEKVYVIGGENVISDEVAGKFGNFIRIYGQDRYKTNCEVVKYFEDVFDFSRVYVSTGENYPDALSAAALSVKNNSPIMLTGSAAKTNDIIKGFVNSVREIVVVGGEKVLPKDIALKIFK
ncbi:MAG: cell wall-binding repeat-containing protein [Caloramator sp.]|nr:cell wall-binding repeat-containing protein [Caloramator sp.]